MISEDVLVTKLSGAARIDLLMEELILADTEEQKCLEKIQAEISNPMHESDDSNSPQSLTHGLVIASGMRVAVTCP